jgi:hypothetical protein
MEDKQEHKKHRKRKEKTEKLLHRKKHKGAKNVDPVKKLESKKRAKLLHKLSRQHITETDYYLEIILKKILEADSSSKQDVIQMFTMIDKGYDANLNDIENQYYKLKLYKITKLLRIAKDPLNKYIIKGTAGDNSAYQARIEKAFCRIETSKNKDSTYKA